MLIKLKYWIFISCLVAVCMLTALPDHLYGAECSGSTYKKPAFNQEITHFSPYDTIYLIVDCADLKPGIYTVHANWVHKQRGIIRSDKYQFKTSDSVKKGIYFWFKLSKKGPVASMLSNQDFHEENFGEWTVDAYLNDELVLTRQFSLSDEIN